jgi:hypothetical protein
MFCSHRHLPDIFRFPAEIPNLLKQYKAFFTIWRKPDKSRRYVLDNFTASTEIKVFISLPEKNNPKQFRNVC